MYVVETKEGAIACMVLSLFCLGTFPALLTLLERRGRLPQHTFLDYTITNFLAAVIFALTLGQFGKSSPDRPNFIQQLSQINRAEILFPGVACFLIAVCLGSAVHSSNTADNKAKLERLSANLKKESKEIDASTISSRVESKDLENADCSSRNAKAGTADFLVQLENRRSIKVSGKSTLIGLCITFFAGVCLSLFSPAFNLATNDQWHTLKEGVPRLTVYTAFFYFGTSFFVIAVVLNVVFLYRPILNLPKTSFKAYLNDWNGRGWAFLAGFLCGFGNGLEFMGGQAAGYAAADSVEAFPLVSTFWGIVLFGEYRRSSRKTYVLLGGMLFMFAAAVVVLMASSGHRHERGVGKSLGKSCESTNLCAN
ncbi:ureide permease 2-like isoform X2 [Momordica charantia]|uniref:Ureide permease 2-like isoform X2 n=1 Tax=Momordica charantia TaxID=3673 RepID=A0A6J1D792_MOMCH|nr:ureide permease 2-like isoform X2 [Momordica charantia]